MACSFIAKMGWPCISTLQELNMDKNTEPYQIKH